MFIKPLYFMFTLKSITRLGTLGVVALGLTLAACQPEPVQPQPEVKVIDDHKQVNDDQPPKDVGDGGGKR